MQQGKKKSTTKISKSARPTPAQSRYMLRLYIAGATSKSTQAVANIKAICEEYLAGRYELEVIDVYKEPSLIESGQIGVIPMLIKVHPHPPQRLIGNLSDTQEVLSALGLLEK